MLDIKNLIEKAEDITTDPQIGFAARITKPVQSFTDGKGTVYELQLVLTCEEETGNWKAYLGTD